MRPLKFLILLGLYSSLFAGEYRKWKNADGSNSFEAEFISLENNKVTLRKAGGSTISFDISKLHQDDRNWINSKTTTPKGKSSDKTPDPNNVFDNLKFGDSRAVVTAKLEASKLVSTEVKSTFFGRTGLNGIFRTNQKIGGLHCFLFFDWDESGGLKEISLQTETKTLDEYKSVLTPCWTELIEIITEIHGKPIQHSSIPTPNSIAVDEMLASHLWRMDQDGTVMLGTTHVDKGYQVIVRFTKEKIEPVIIPNP